MDNGYWLKVWNQWLDTSLLWSRCLIHRLWREKDSNIFILEHETEIGRLNLPFEFVATQWRLSYLYFQQY